MSEREDVTPADPVAPPPPPPEALPPELPEGADAPAAAEAAPAAPTIDASELALKVEALLLATDRPLPTGKLAEILGKPGAKAVNAALAQLNDLYEQTGRSFRIEELAGGWQIMTLPQYKEVLAALHKSRQETRLSPAALETLAIIAYKQPILRADIEAIRGVACGEVLRSLMERHLVKIVGRAEELGRPMLYGTTKTFLEVFGLADLTDLPKVEALKPTQAV
jgi:segregation and condensation protein B